MKVVSHAARFLAEVASGGIQKYQLVLRIQQPIFIEPMIRFGTPSSELIWDRIPQRLQYLCKEGIPCRISTSRVLQSWIY